MGKSSRQWTKLFITNYKTEPIPEPFYALKVPPQGKKYRVETKMYFSIFAEMRISDNLVFAKFSQKSPKQQIFHSSACISSCLAHHIFAQIFAQICTSGEKINRKQIFLQKWSLCFTRKARTGTIIQWDFKVLTYFREFDIIQDYTHPKKLYPKEILGPRISKTLSITTFFVLWCDTTLYDLKKIKCVHRNPVGLFFVILTF